MPVIFSERFVIVPGNHDVDRTRVDRVLEVGLHDALREPDEIDRIWREPDYRSRAVARVQRFVDWCRGKGLQTESTIIRVDDKSVGFACLNSAWLCHRDGERHNIAITRAQAMEAEDLVSEADLKLALSHHPLEWLHDQDKVRIRECLFAKFHAYLQGHMHVGDGTQISTPRGNTIALQAPAIHSAKCFSGFQLYEFDLSSRHITVHSFKILENRLQYVPNQEILPDGKPWTAPLAAAQADSRALLAVQQLNTSLGVRYATSLERLVPIVAHPQKLALSERLLPGLDRVRWTVGLRR